MVGFKIVECVRVCVLFEIENNTTSTIRRELPHLRRLAVDIEA